MSSNLVFKILLFFIFPILGIIIIGSFCYWFYEWPPKFSENLEDWSATAGYFGGMLGALFSFANIIVLWYITSLVESTQKKRAEDLITNDSKEKKKERDFVIKQFNISLMQNSYAEITNNFKEAKSNKIINLVDLLNNASITEEFVNNEIRQVKNVFLNLIIELDVYKKSNTHIFEFLDLDHKRYPKKEWGEVNRSIKSIITILKSRNPNNYAIDEMRKCVEEYSNSRDKLLKLFQDEIRNSLYKINYE